MIGGQHHRNEGSVSPEYPLLRYKDEESCNNWSIALKSYD